MRNPNSTIASDVVILAAGILLAAMFTGQLISHVVFATDSSAPARNESVPVGTVVSWAGQLKSIPKNWLLCDGKLLDNRKYPELFKAIGKSWGGKGTKFNLPDLRGRFLRGVDAGSNRDPDRNKRSASRPGGNKINVGSVQGAAIPNHSHIVKPHVHTQIAPTDNYFIFYADGAKGAQIYSVYTYFYATQEGKSKIEDAVHFKTKNPLDVGEETRPINAAVHWIIKVK